MLVINLSEGMHVVHTHTKMHNEQIVEQQLNRRFAVQTTTENNNNHLNSNEKLLKIFWDVRSIVDQLFIESFIWIAKFSLSHTLSLPLCVVRIQQTLAQECNVNRLAWAQPHAD